MGLLIILVANGVVQAAPFSFLQHVKQAKPDQRIRLVLNYFDTCQAVIQHQPTAFRVLDQLDALSQRGVALFDRKFNSLTPN